MEPQQTIITEIRNSVATLSLNRPQVHNAMDMLMIRELTSSFKALESDQRIRIVVLASSGKHFSAGADLNWMKEGMVQDQEQLRSESLELADLFKCMAASRMIVLSAIGGKVMGGANGLVAVSDLVIAEESATFTFSEVKLGLAPATIAPFILRKIGSSRTTDLMLTGRPILAEEALAAGLVHYVCRQGTLRATTGEIIGKLLSNGPEAMREVKHLLRWLQSGPTDEQVREHTAGVIARLRISPEGQEGMNAFFEKRRPGWYEAD